MLPDPSLTLGALIGVVTIPNAHNTNRNTQIVQSTLFSFAGHECQRGSKAAKCADATANHLGAPAERGSSSA